MRLGFNRILLYNNGGEIFKVFFISIMTNMQLFYTLYCTYSGLFFHWIRV